MIISPFQLETEGCEPDQESDGLGWLFNLDLVWVINRWLRYIYLCVNAYASHSANPLTQSPVPGFQSPDISTSFKTSFIISSQCEMSGYSVWIVIGNFRHTHWQVTFIEVILVLVSLEPNSRKILICIQLQHHFIMNIQRKPTYIYIYLCIPTLIPITNSYAGSLLNCYIFMLRAHPISQLTHYKTKNTYILFISH